jgi:hypothetical protein
MFLKSSLAQHVSDVAASIVRSTTSFYSHIFFCNSAYLCPGDEFASETSGMCAQAVAYQVEIHQSCTCLRHEEIVDGPIHNLCKGGCFADGGRIAYRLIPGDVNNLRNYTQPPEPNKNTDPWL